MSPALLSIAGAGLVLAVGFGLTPRPDATVSAAGLEPAVAPVKRAGAPPLATMRRDTVASLITQLDSPVPAARALVACALAERKADAAPAVASLVAMLGDDAAVSAYVCREEWWDGHGDQRYWSRGHSEEPTTPGQEAARALARIGTIAFDPVLKVLPSGGGHARRNAAWVLGALRDERAVAPLIAQLSDPLATVREHVVWSLGAIRDARAVEPLGRTLGQDQSGDVRRQAAWALGAVRDERGVDPLVRGLKDRDHGVRKQAAWALGAIRDGRGVDPLVKALADRDSTVRKQAAWALGAIRDARAVDRLIAVLGDGDREVRKQAAWALGAIGDARASTGLTAALEDKDAEVRKQAAWALGVVVRRQ
jgi:HEAT repeat protein